MYQKKSSKKIIFMVAIFLIASITTTSAQTVNSNLDVENPSEITVKEADTILLKNENEEFSIMVDKITEKTITVIFEETKIYVTTSKGKKSTINLDNEATSDIALTLMSTTSSAVGESFEFSAKIMFQKLTSSPKNIPSSTAKAPLLIFAGIIIISALFLIIILLRRIKVREKETKKQRKKKRSKK